MERRLVLLVISLVVIATVATDFGMGVIEPSVAVAEERKRQGVFQRLFRPRDPPPEMAPPRAIPPRGTPRGNSSQNKRRVPQVSGMRTLCVRTCDGYYFPISHAATRKRFQVDEAVCKAMYGGADAEVYIHDNGSSVDTAVSLKGKPLAREPYAFAFRQTFNEACHTELKEGLHRLAAAFLAKAAEQSTTAAEAQPTVSRALPSPPLRVIAGIDPETAANRAGDFVVRPAKGASIAAESEMRKVGSDYYYSEPTVIANLRDPLYRGPEFGLVGSSQAAERVD